MSKEYIYAVSRIHYKEQGLLTKADLDSLLLCRDYDSCIRMLSDKGWGDGNSESADELLSSERSKMLEFIDELIEDKSVLNVLRCQADFQNLKAAVKCTVTDSSIDNMLLSGGSLSGDKIYEYVKSHDFDALPPHLRDCAREAMRILLETGNGQLLPVMEDEPAYPIRSEEIRIFAREAGFSSIELYAGFDGTPFSGQEDGIVALLTA